MRTFSITYYAASCYIAILTVLLRTVAAALIFLVRAYQVLLGRIFGGHCRYQPTCSAYAIDAIRNCGPIKGLRLSVWRVLRCHPFSKGGYDPAPEAPGSATSNAVTR
jgi:hypothetical protein